MKMPRPKGKKDQNIYALGRQLFDAFMGYDEQRVREILPKLAVAFKSKALRTFTRRYGKLDLIVKVGNIDFKNYRFELDIFNENGKHLGTYRVTNALQFWSKNDVKFTIYFFHKFVQRLCS